MLRPWAETDISVLDSTGVTLHKRVLELLPVSALSALLEGLFSEPKMRISDEIEKGVPYFLT